MATVQEKAGKREERKGKSDSPAPSTSNALAWWKWVCGLLMIYVCYGAFYIAGGAEGFRGGSGNAARIVFFHVPCAVLSSVAYFVAAYYAYRYLSARHNPEADAKTAAAMELGFLFCILTTTTGSVFSGTQWGSYWNWDPRQTSIVIMLLLYAAYLVLRGAVADNPAKGARLSAVYVLVTLVPAVFLIWVVPRIVSSLHPGDTLIKSSNTGATYKMVLYPAFLAFTLLFAWMLQLRVRLTKLKLRREEY